MGSGICADLRHEEYGNDLENQRSNLDIKIPDWSVEDGKVTLTEKFIGTIDYTGTLEGTTLTLYNGDPANPMTAVYVYEKQ